MTFRPTVLVVDEPTELRWQGRLFVPGLYDGEHRFVLTAVDDGERTRLTHAETFRGALVGFINRRIGNDVDAEFNQMNEALKHRVENGYPVNAFRTVIPVHQVNNSSSLTDDSVKTA